MNNNLWTELSDKQAEKLAGGIISPNGRYFTERIVSGNNAHYSVLEFRGKAAPRYIFTTHAQYSTPNDVKAGIFSTNSEFFAAAYHYGHQGRYTWIGVWRTDNGQLVKTSTTPGWITNIGGFLPEGHGIRSIW